MGTQALPDFLRICIEKGLIDETIARRIELYRRTRGVETKRQPFFLLLQPPDPSMTFANYFVTKGNSFAVELARTVGSRAATEVPYNPLYVYGDVGTGKTHLLSAIANALPEDQVLLANTVDLDIELERADAAGQRAELMEWLTSFEILLVDDIQLCEGRETLQRVFFSVYNAVLKAGNWLVITSDVPPTRLAGVEERLISRLGGGAIVNLQIGEREERQELVRYFAQGRTLSDEVVEFLADNVTDTIRHVKGTVKNLLALADWTDSEVTLEMAQSLVHPTGPGLRNEDVRTTSSEVITSSAVMSPPRRDPSVTRFKAMIAEAETQEEQILALQIAVTERISQLRKEQASPELLTALERILDSLRQGKLAEAVLSFQRIEGV